MLGVCGKSSARGVQRLHQEQTQHHVLFHSFFPHTVSEWNVLPTAISSAPSLESFQSRSQSQPHDEYQLEIICDLHMF